MQVAVVAVEHLQQQLLVEILFLVVLAAAALGQLQRLLVAQAHLAAMAVLVFQIVQEQQHQALYRAAVAAHLKAAQAEQVAQVKLFFHGGKNGY